MRKSPKAEGVVVAARSTLCIRADMDRALASLEVTATRIADEAARARVVVNAAGVKRSYTFKRDESRLLEPHELERQLRETAFVGDMPNLSKYTPR